VFPSVAYRTDAMRAKALPCINGDEVADKVLAADAEPRLDLP
jgi:hypothetical protein